MASARCRLDDIHRCCATAKAAKWPNQGRGSSGSAVSSAPRSGKIIAPFSGNGLKSPEGRKHMKTLAKFGIPLLFVAAGYAENWNAKLLDASCYDKSATSSHSSAQTSDRKSREDLAKNCAPTAATTSYAIETSSGH